MTLTSVNISVIILMLIFQSTFASDSHLLFPKEFPKERLVKCGFDHEIYGISILDDYLYQLGRCSMVIYPPPLDQYLDENLDHLKFDNGYRYNYSEIIPKTSVDICDMATSVDIYDNNEPILLLNHLKMPDDNRNQHNEKARELHDNHYMLYFIGSINDQWVYRIYDFDTVTFENCSQSTTEIGFHYIMFTDGNEIFHSLNEKLMPEIFALKGDCITNTQSLVNGFICIRQTDNGKSYLISTKIRYQECELLNVKLTKSFLNTISFTFTAFNKIIMISKNDERVLITDITFLRWRNRDEHPLQIKSLNDFFICNNLPNDAIINGEKTSSTTESFGSKLKSKIFIIILVVIVIVIIIIGIIIIVIYMKRHKKIKKSIDIAKAKSPLLLNVTKDFSSISSKLSNISVQTTNTSDTSKTNIQSLSPKEIPQIFDPKCN